MDSIRAFFNAQICAVKEALFKISNNLDIRIAARQILISENLYGLPHVNSTAEMRYIYLNLGSDGLTFAEGPKVTRVSHSGGNALRCPTFGRFRFLYEHGTYIA